MRIVTGGWLAIAVVSIAACVQQEESYPMAIPAPLDAGITFSNAASSSSSSSSSSAASSSSSGGPADGGAPDGCSLTETVCTPVPDAGPDASCPQSGTVTGTVVTSGTCTTELVSLGGPVTAAGCCSSACLPAGCKP